MIYLYALSDAPQEEISLDPGVVDQAVCERQYGPISAWISPLAGAISPTTENVWRHEAVVEALMAVCTVLPVRFGSLFADGEALGAILAAHEHDLYADLERVRGRIELSLRVLWEQAAPPPSNQLVDASLTGREYMQLRLQEERRMREHRRQAEALAARIHQPLAQLAVESRQQLLLTPRLLLTSAYLVEREQMATFEQQVESLRAAWPQLRLLCTGPWPAYSFVTMTTVSDC